MEWASLGPFLFATVLYRLWMYILRFIYFKERERDLPSSDSIPQMTIMAEGLTELKPRATTLVSHMGGGAQGLEPSSAIRRGL